MQRKAAPSGRTSDPSAVILDSYTLCSSPESGHRADYGGAKRKKGSLGYYRIPDLAGVHPLTFLDIVLSALEKTAMSFPTLAP